MQAPIKRFIREIVDTGFQAGLLREGMVQYPGMETMGGPDEVAEHAWSRVSLGLALNESSLTPDHVGVDRKDEVVRGRTQDVPFDRCRDGTAD